MEIRSVATLPVRPAPPAPPRPLEAAPALSRPGEAALGRESPRGRAAEALRLEGSSVSFEVDRRSTGVAVVRLVDRSTGDVVLQMPPEGVLRFVAELIDDIRGREVTDGAVQR